jgi:hypothetical protein
MLTRTVKACGSDASVLASSSREASFFKLLGGEGGKKADHPGDHEAAVKTIAQGTPVESACLW